MVLSSLTLIRLRQCVELTRREKKFYYIHGILITAITISYPFLNFNLLKCVCVCVCVCVVLISINCFHKLRGYYHCQGTLYVLYGASRNNTSSTRSSESGHSAVPSNYILYVEMVRERSSKHTIDLKYNKLDSVPAGAVLKHRLSLAHLSNALHIGSHIIIGK
jgi:hypothetical protein